MRMASSNKFERTHLEAEHIRFGSHLRIDQEEDQEEDRNYWT